MHARWLVLTASVGALALAIAALVGGSATSPTAGAPQRFVDSYTEAGASISLANQTVANGTYLVTGRFDIRSLGAPVTLDCGLADANGGIGYLSNERETVDVTAEWRRVELGSVFDLPDTTIALDCTVLASGVLKFAVRDVSLAALPDLGSISG